MAVNVQGWHLALLTVVGLGLDPTTDAAMPTVSIGHRQLSLILVGRALLRE
jgi:hypothetical protein